MERRKGGLFRSPLGEEWGGGEGVSRSVDRKKGVSKGSTRDIKSNLGTHVINICIEKDLLKFSILAIWGHLPPH